MDEKNWEVYKISKLSKFMELVKFAMQVFKNKNNNKIIYSGILSYIYLESNFLPLNPIDLIG
jgi:hypothetical protein